MAGSKTSVYGRLLTTYSYDKQGRCIREETTDAGKAIGYTTWEYANGKPANQTFARRKGFPDVFTDGLNQTGKNNRVAN